MQTAASPVEFEYYLAIAIDAEDPQDEESLT